MTKDEHRKILKNIDEIADILAKHAVACGNEFQDDQHEEACDELNRQIDNITSSLADRTREVFWDQ